MVDQFTKWVECVPLPTQCTEEMAQAAIDNLFFHVLVYHYRFSPIKAGTLMENYVRLYRSIRPEPLPMDLQFIDFVHCFLGKKLDQ